MTTVHTSLNAPLSELEQREDFLGRHLGLNAETTPKVLAAIGVDSVDALIDQTIPADIRNPGPLAMPEPTPEHEALELLRAMASRNILKKSLIGLGYYGTLLPAVIQRNVLENPAWYTAYTPYQAEISQGRLEALLTFQQVFIDLTGLPLANASLLDEATAGAEAMTMARRISKSKSNSFFVDEECFPQTIDVIRTRAKYFDYELVIGPVADAAKHDVFGALLQSPNQKGELIEADDIIAALHAKGAIVAMATDPMALVLTRSPGEQGADIALGSSQRFGIPMGFGGPHAAYFSCREEYARSMPGRIIGVSKDTRGKPALRLTLQTREQHIRREKANSNICTSQVLLANMAGMYATYHGPKGLATIAGRIHRLAALFAAGARAGGAKVLSKTFFDTVLVETGARTDELISAAETAGYNLRKLDDKHISLAFDETHNRDDVVALLKVFGADAVDIGKLDTEVAGKPVLGGSLVRTSPILQHPVFNSHHTEHQMLRYLRKLQNRDLAMDHSMISLGSCTMKLNATSEMIPITWPEFALPHPFAPAHQMEGYRVFLESFSDYLKAVTGLDAVSLQPNSGASGEYAGMVAISRYHESRGEGQRNVCLIPKSSHGTNPATAHMVGMDVVVVACDDNGNVDIADLEAKATKHADKLSALMITYPSTHGVFEEGIKQMCEIVHRNGGQVYMDGANLNAQVGITSPAAIGADVTHLNLHKTFCIPHGGGGPGMGPIVLKAHLAPFMADHVFTPTGDANRPNAGQTAVSAAAFGSASILPISWMYMTMMGAKGLKQVTETAIVNANYLATRLGEHYPVLYTGSKGRVAHECILDIRPIKAATGISEVDIAKRLMDYGFHAPTMSFPVAGTIMVEPTESEDLPELDRFVDAMISIREEIRAVEAGKLPADNNPLVNAPHTQDDITGEWDRPYSREQAAFPLPWLRANKFWPFVNRVDDVYGDRNLFCGCVPMDEIESLD